MTKYLTLDSNGVFIAASARVDYMYGGVVRSFVPRLCEDGSDDDGTVCVRAERSQDGGSVSFRLFIENISGSDIFLSQAYPAVIDGADFKVGSCPQGELIVFSQGRHKNDLPSVCRLGRRDVCWDDMLSSLTEGGAMIPAEKKPGITDIIGDSLSVIHAPDASLTIGYMTAQSQLAESSLRVADDGTVVSFEIGCIFNCLMKPGSVRATEVVRFDTDPDVLRAIDNFAGIKARDFCARVGKKPSVWCSWYYYGSNLTPDDITENLTEISKLHLPFDTFQIDDAWQICHGDWNPKPIYSQRGMKNIADEIKSHGLRPGIWTAPFIADERARVVKEHPEWLLKEKNGEFAVFAGRFFILDVTRPDVLVYFTELYRRLTYGMGFTYHKLDFSRAFVQVKDPDPYDPYITPVEAYVNAVRAIRDGMGEDAYFLMCGGLYDPLIGIVDAQRTGADVTSMWIEPGFDYPTLPYTVKQNTLRYYMNKWWNNDPDALMVRRKTVGSDLQLGLLNDEEVKTFTVNQYFGGGLVCSTEKLAEIDYDRLMNLRHVMPAVNTEPVPRKLADCERFQSQIDVKVTSPWGDEWHTVVFVNWGDEPMPLSVSLDTLICGGFIKDGEKYAVSTFYSRMLIKDAVSGGTYSLGFIAPHGAEIVRIGKTGRAQVVLSDAHYSFGAELDYVGDDGIKGVNPYPAAANYVILSSDGKLIETVL